MPLSDDFLNRSSELIRWYQNSQRDLPWRRSPIDPYRIWISEIMSQQSTIVTVVPYFERWIKNFPDLRSLAAASEDDVVGQWAGLGYYSRARNLLKAARHLQTLSGWPRAVDEWLRVPGVGPYTARAILAIAFNEPVLPLDGNVIRVLARVGGFPDPLNSRRDYQAVADFLSKIADGLKPGSHRDVSQALMELGAILCRPGAKALCELCPLQKICEAFQCRSFAEIPRTKSRPIVEKIRALALIYKNAEGSLLLRQIPTGRRLSGQWELPWMEVQDSLSMTRLKEKYGVRGPWRHSITRFRYEVYCVEAGRWGGDLPGSHVFWNSDGPAPGTLTTLTRKVLSRSGPD